jgi:hypothetical protein
VGEADVSGEGVQQPDEGRAERRAQLLLEVGAARARRRTGGLTIRLPRSLPVPADRVERRDPVAP